MINFSDCYIMKVKSFLGLKSIDPPVPFDEFIKDNLGDLNSLIEKNQIIGLDDQGNEIDSLLLNKYILDSSEKIFEKINSDVIINTTDDKNDSYDIQEELDRIKEIDTEEKEKIEHKQRLLNSLDGCEEGHRLTLERGLDNNNQIIEKLKEERKSLLIRITQKIEDGSP